MVNPVAWWSLNEGSGSRANDRIGNNDGILINNPTWGQGQVNGGLSFDGVNDYVQIADNNALDFGTGDFSISTWVRTSDRSGIDVLLDKRVETSGPVQGYVLYNYNGNLGFQLADGGWTNYVSNVSITDGQWHHVTVTIDRDSRTGGRWYVDGVEVGNFNPTGRQGSLSNDRPLTMGRRSDHPFWAGHFNGSLDEVQLFNTSLSASDVLDLYNGSNPINNDNFANRFVLSGDSVTTTGSNVGFTGESGEPYQSGTLNSAWWTWTASSDGTVTIDTNGSNFDTYLSVFSGNSLGGLTRVARDDDGGRGLQSEVSFDVTEGTTYQIAVDGYSSRTGDIQLNIDLNNFSNDNFANRIVLSGDSVSTTGSNVGFTGESGEPYQSGTLNSAWWTWTASSDGTVTIDTNGSNFDTYLSVFSGNSLGGLTRVARDDDGGRGLQSEVSFNVTEGSTYQIAVDGYSSRTGDIQLNIDLGSLGFTGDDFDPDIDSSQWEDITNGRANRNFIGSTGDSLFFTGSGTRQATTNYADFSEGHFLRFDLIFGNSRNGGENADAGEDVLLEYSTNGSTWNQIKTYDTEDFTRFSSITEYIPPAAISSTTQFRWRQLRHSGSNFDQWGLDNVSLGGLNISRERDRGPFGLELDPGAMKGLDSDTSVMKGLELDTSIVM